MIYKIFSWYHNGLYGIACYKKIYTKLKIVNRRAAYKQINHSW